MVPIMVYPCQQVYLDFFKLWLFARDLGLVTQNDMNPRYCTDYRPENFTVDLPIPK